MLRAKEDLDFAAEGLVFRKGENIIGIGVDDTLKVALMDRGLLEEVPDGPTGSEPKAKPAKAKAKAK